MDSVDSVDLLLQLVRAEDEESVEKIVTNHPILSRDENSVLQGIVWGKSNLTPFVTCLI